MAMEPAPLKLPGKFARLKAWAKKNPKKCYAIGAIGLILIGGTTTGLVLSMQDKEPAPKPQKKAAVIKKSPPKPIYHSLLTGEAVADKPAITTPVTAIMLENSPSARPQSGLKDAEIVYEAIAEGGITRFLAIYQQHKPQMIGPVRSLRPYYLDWATPYDASIAHVGGSKHALDTVRNGSYRDIDQFFNGSYFWRATDRAAPHNVYTSFAKLDELNAKKGFTVSNPLSFERADDDKKQPTQDATQVNLKISSALYNSSYAYDPTTKLYARSEGGQPHLDREAGQIQARVIVALRVDMSRVFEDGYRESITTIGSGSAMIFQNGHAIQATWSKDSPSAQFTFTDSNGQAIKLARGTTWLSAIPNQGGDVTWQ